MFLHGIHKGENTFAIFPLLSRHAEVEAADASNLV